MTSLTDLNLPLSTLEFAGDDRATVEADELNVVQVSGLLQSVVEHSARQAAALQPIHIVSVTFDVSASPEANAPLHFESRIDRKTRTLVFASGFARQGDRHLVKATVVFRID